MGDRCLDILFVCLGNICRSPVAAGVMKRLYAERGLTGVIESAGTADWQAGNPADPRSIKIALDHGIDIRDHRARRIERSDLDRFDLIVVMDGSNHRDVSMMAPAEMQDRIRRLLEFSDEPDGDVTDPFTSHEAAFRHMFAVIEEGCTALADTLARQAQEGGLVSRAGEQL